MDDQMWDGFARAIVRLELTTGATVLRPTEIGETGTFPFDGDVYIVTAHNPAGIMSDDEANAERHRALGQALADHECVPTIGSAADGSFAEPGYAVLDTTRADATTLARRFGQRAIYRWHPDGLTILGVDETVELELGWTLDDPPEISPLLSD